ncbi:MAG TPA: hypothetical protein VGG74_32845 [Kofleriaceae bacterium]
MRCGTALLLAVIGAGGCVVDHHADPSQVIEPRTCTVDVALSSDGAETSIPLTLDATGSTICLHLDATDAAVAHFAASTNPLAGDSSGVAAVLQDLDLGTLQDGWDVTPDDDDAHTYANVEWNPPAHELTEAVLWLRAPQPPVAVTLQLSLFEPAAE